MLLLNNLLNNRGARLNNKIISNGSTIHNDIVPDSLLRIHIYLVVGCAPMTL